MHCVVNYVGISTAQQQAELTCLWCLIGDCQAFLCQVSQKEMNFWLVTESKQQKPLVTAATEAQNKGNAAHLFNTSLTALNQGIALSTNYQSKVLCSPMVTSSPTKQEKCWKQIIPKKVVAGQLQPMDLHKLLPLNSARKFMSHKIL